MTPLELTQGDVAMLTANARGLASLGMAGGYDEVLYELADALDALFEQLEGESREQDITDRCRALRNLADTLEAEGGHAGTVAHYRAVADGLAEAHRILRGQR